MSVLITAKELRIEQDKIKNLKYIDEITDFNNKVISAIYSNRQYIELSYISITFKPLLKKCGYKIEYIESGDKSYIYKISW